MAYLSARAALALFALAFTAAPIWAQTLKPDQVLSSLELRPLSPPNPVLGADNRIHLAYELVAVNATKLFVTLDKVEAVDAQGKVLAAMNGAELAAMMTVHGGNRATLSPGGSAFIFLDVTVAAGAPMPKQLSARVTLTRQLADVNGKPAAFPTTEPVPATISFAGAATKVGAAAVVIAPPLRGGRWVAVNGCCSEVTSHRGAVMAVNGAFRVPERFAIDWVQLDASNRLFTGDLSKLTSYPYCGTAVHAVADGTVVNLYDGSPEQVPGQPAKGITPANIGGNMLVIDIGGGHYAFYAHLQPGSLRVKLGEKVKTGDVIALLGNTGNSTAPHLHFHVMDGTSPLDANGLPYVFTRFTGDGVVQESTEEDMFAKGTPATIDRAALAGPHRNQLPLNNQVVDFGN
jgi:murein DD-endopeptidase MepM/ murein hydrolase activator NlpD